MENSPSSATVGQPAPLFSAPAAFPADSPADAVRTVSLGDYRDRWLVFFWYPSDFTFVCPTEITAFSDRVDEFEELGAAVLGASTDSAYSHRAWMRTPRLENGIADTRFPILADRTHAIARAYGVLIAEEGVALRGLFIIDPDGVLQYAVINNLNIGRSVDETLRVLQALQSGGLCPSDWKPGQQTLSS
ncbi:MAG: peroxiredoxin [Fibrella sp.]|nr:peroxiredoxin [Armatimonadota bacterium]